jgi:bisphosphoglycerate-independent phosphoglycerate mutase (AlkP superfamily)
LAEAPTVDVEGEVADAVVAFVHVEVSDLVADREASAFRQALKHLKWLANKRALKQVVLHSFAHLGGDSAPPAAAQALLERLAGRLTENGYTTHVTPFGYSNQWELSVYGEGSAKVWKEI